MAHLVWQKGGEADVVTLEGEAVVVRRGFHRRRAFPLVFKADFDGF